MWDRFTDRVRRAVNVWQAEAHQAKQAEVAPEHILISILCEESNATDILRACGADAAKVVQSARGELAQGSGEAMTEMVLSPVALSAVRQAAEISKGMGDRFIGSEHLLLGLLAIKEGLVPKVIAPLGLDVEVVAQRTRELGDRQQRETTGEERE